MATKPEKVEYEIERIFIDLGIRYKIHAPDLINFWIAEEAPHSSALLISLRAKKYVGEGLTNRVTLLITILKDKKGECPDIFETKHIHITATHFKPEPESEYCFYHYLGEDLDMDEIAPEVREIISGALKENRKRKKEEKYIYNPETSLWEKGEDANPASREHFQSQNTCSWLKDKYQKFSF